MYACISIPFRLAFNVPSVQGWAILEATINIIFIIDILINFNTAFYKKGNLVTSRKTIALNYLKFWFWLDLVASFPYDWMMLAITGNDSEDSSNDSVY